MEKGKGGAQKAIGVGGRGEEGGRVGVQIWDRGWPFHGDAFRVLLEDKGLDGGEINPTHLASGSLDKRRDFCTK